MSDRLPGLPDRLPSRARRRLMAVLPLALLGALVAGFALAPRPAGTHSNRPRSIGLVQPSPTTTTGAPARPAPPLQTGPSHVSARAGGAQRERERSRTAHRPAVRGPVSERPPAPAPGSAEGMKLAVARRFAVAYMPYQVGLLPRWARTAFARTCTPGFARYLLAQPAARPTALQAAHPKTIETYRVAGVEPAGAPDTVAVSYVSEQDHADVGEFLLRLVEEHGRWLVASLEA
jgi:hypothetical protein